MTERGLPIVDGAPACPFVAFDDDRDERSTSPDHRHRCYAESPPAPRALAHQEAYCLASAFPVCPTFQDWARREAARTRPDEPPRDDEADLEPVVIDRPPRKGSSTWSAPPPWSGGDAGSAQRAAERAGASPYASDDPSEAADAGMAAGAAAAGMVGAAGAIGAAGAAAAGSSAASAAGVNATGANAAGANAAATNAAGGGLSGSYADRLAGGGSGRGVAGPATPQLGATGPGRAEPAARPTEPEAWDDEADDEGAPPPRVARSRERLDARPADRAGDGGHGRDDGDRERDAWAPAWERPRRLEAYPTLRSRRFSGLGLSSLLIAVVAILLAALLLFFLPSLLGVGSGPSTASPTPSTAVAASQALESAVPSTAPAPTAQTYVVQSGDTLSRIANKFHVSLQALIDANKTNLPNPDKLQIGDVINIPTLTPTALPAASS